MAAWRLVESTVDNGRRELIQRLKSSLGTWGPVCLGLSPNPNPKFVSSFGLFVVLGDPVCLKFTPCFKIPNTKFVSCFGLFLILGTEYAWTCDPMFQTPLPEISIVSGSAHVALKAARLPSRVASIVGHLSSFKFMSRLFLFSPWSGVVPKPPR